MFGLVEWRGAGERCGAREKRLDGVQVFVRCDGIPDEVTGGKTEE